MSFLDETGLSYFWSKIKQRFLLISGGTLTGGLTATSLTSTGSTKTKSLSINGNSVNDFIVAQGSSGGWRYAKYANGVAWCYYTKYSDGVDISNPWGGVFISPENAIPSIAYPFSFAAIPTELVATQAAIVGSMGLVNGTVQNTKAKTGTYNLVSGISGVKDCNISYFVIGRWK